MTLRFRIRKLLKRSADAALMVLTAEQHLKIALLYEKAAADRLGVPPQQRAAFARKAKWFRMKARIRAKMEAATALAAHLEMARLKEGARAEPRFDEACVEDVSPGNGSADARPVNGAAVRLDEACLDEACLDEACLDQASLDEACLDQASLDEARRVELRGAVDAAPAKPRYRSIAERIAATRTVKA